MTLNELQMTVGMGRIPLGLKSIGPATEDPQAVASTDATSKSGDASTAATSKHRRQLKAAALRDATSKGLRGAYVSACLTRFSQVIVRAPNTPHNRAALMRWIGERGTLLCHS